MTQLTPDMLFAGHQAWMRSGCSADTTEKKVLIALFPILSEMPLMTSDPETALKAIAAFYRTAKALEPGRQRALDKARDIAFDAWVKAGGQPTADKLQLEHIYEILSQMQIMQWPEGEAYVTLAPHSYDRILIEHVGAFYRAASAAASPSPRDEVRQAIAFNASFGNKMNR